MSKKEYSREVAAGREKVETYISRVRKGARSFSRREQRGLRIAPMNLGRMF